MRHVHGTRQRVGGKRRHAGNGTRPHNRTGSQPSTTTRTLNPASPRCLASRSLRGLEYPPGTLVASVRATGRTRGIGRPWWNWWGLLCDRSHRRIVGSPATASFGWQRWPIPCTNYDVPIQNPLIDPVYLLTGVWPLYFHPVNLTLPSPQNLSRVLAGKVTASGRS